MKRIIGIVNENLRTVIKGIESYHTESVEELNEIEKTIREKGKKAKDLKKLVGTSRKNISKLENEIDELQADLEELNNKFGLKNLTEMVEVGTREINGKILEKRSLIDEESERIKDITNQANELKESLISLNRSREFTKVNMRNSEILGLYYKNTLNDIIDFTENHTDEIEGKVVTSDQDISKKEIDKANISNDIDDAIFEEIENFSINDLNDDDIKNALSSINEQDTEEEKVEIKEISTEEELDEILDDASELMKITNDIVEKTANIPVPEVKEEKKEEKVVEATEEVIEVKEIPVVDNIPTEEDTTDEDDAEESGDDTSSGNEVLTPFEITTEEKSLTDEDINAELLSKNPNFEKELEELRNLFSSGNEKIKDNIQNADKVVELEIEEENKPPHEDVFNISFEDDEEDNEDEENIFKQLNSMMNENNESETFNQNLSYETGDFDQEFNELGLDKTNFNDEDFAKFKEHFNKVNVQSHLDVMKKHNINKNKIYTSVDVINEVTPQNVDVIISMLENNYSDAIIEYVYGYLNKVSILKLEGLVHDGKEYELSEILYNSITDDKKETISSVLNLTNSELKSLKSSSKGNLFRIINSFPEIVKANYNTLKSYNINNLNECFTKYPERFIYNPDKFAAILDKYDPQDLARCVNKNAAVINKL